MTVTEQLRKDYLVYGASDYNLNSNLAACRGLNYAKGPSISRPDKQFCSVVPHTFRYEGDLGLFGVENYFTKITVNAPGDIVLVCYDDFGWECAEFGVRAVEEPDWELADVDPLVCLDGSVINQYECANTLGDNLPYIEGGGFLSVELKNLGTGNYFADDYFDVRIYTDQREEHPFNKMYIRQKSEFYLGFHARNTKRLPFDVACVIGVEYLAYESIEDPQLIMPSQRP